MHFLSKLSKLFQKDGYATHGPEKVVGEGARQAQAATEPKAVIDRQALVYPPIDPGMPVARLNDLLAAQAELITRIKTHSAMDADRFEVRYGGPIERLAAYVGSIPGTANGLYAGPGGLLKACTEMSLYAFQASHGRIFTGHLGVEQRFLLEVRWQYVCFAAGLLWPVGKTIDQIQVASDRGVTWPARVKPMLGWAEQTSTSHLHINWPEQDFIPGPSATGSSLVGNVIGEKNLAWLEEGSPAMVTALMGIVSGQREAKYGTAFDLINDMWRRVCQAEEARNPQTYGRAMYGQHMGPHILDSIAMLLRSGQWKENKTPLIVNSEGVYLIWPDAGEEIIGMANASGKKGFPNTSAGLLATIENAKLIQVDPNIGPLVDIPDSEGEIRSSIKMLKPMSVIVNYDPANYVAIKVKEATDEEDEDVVQPEKPIRKKKSVTPQIKQDLEGGVVTESTADLEPPAAGGDPFSGILELVEAAAANAVGTMEDESACQEKETEPADDTEPIVAKEVDATSLISQKKAVVEGPKTVEVEAAQAKRTEDASKQAHPLKVEEEVKEIKYSDLLPKDLRSSLNNMTAETLGKLVMVWRDNGPNDQMRTVEKGIAFSVITLKGLVHDVPSFIENMAQQGYIDINPMTPGRKIQDVAIPEGSKRRVSCFVISRGLVQKLGL